MLFISSPPQEINRNLRNCSPTGWLRFPKVQILLRIKLFTTAILNPTELARYLFQCNFSLQNHVHEKSIAIPAMPTTPNLSIVNLNIEYTFR